MSFEEIFNTLLPYFIAAVPSITAVITVIVWTANLKGSFGKLHKKVEEATLRNDIKELVQYVRDTNEKLDKYIEIEGRVNRRGTKTKNDKS